MMNSNCTEVRYFPCFTIKIPNLGEITAFFDADDPNYFNENDRGIVVNKESALYFYDTLTEKDRYVAKQLFTRLVDAVQENTDETIQISDFHFEKHTSYVTIERLEWW